MAGKPKRFNAREVEALLSQHGFSMVTQRGSHRKWWNQAKNIQVVVPMHGNQPLPIGTMRQILTLAEIPESDWKS